jgi:hypothetical protein
MSARKLDTHFTIEHSKVVNNMKKVKQSSSLEFGKKLLLPLLASRVMQTEPTHQNTTSLHTIEV